MKSALALFLTAATYGAASAHVAAIPAEARAGAYQAFRFQVGHGCGEAATTALRIELPEGLGAARPQPKPGWSLSVTREGDRLVAVTWTGRLPADQFDDFALLVRTPVKSGPIYFPAVQTCGRASQQWIQVPEPGHTEPLSRPAPRVTITGEATEAPHAH
jgi:uncharacterized protein YcnI